MTEDERKYIKRLLAHEEDNKRFFSNQPKANREHRERLTCAMFLRALGIPFAVEDLISVPDDGPPDHIDVTFQEARFQVTELIDPDRHRQAETNERIRELKAATTPDEALRGCPSTYVPMSHAEAYALITEKLAKKASSYEASARAKLDALVHIQLHWRYLHADSPLSNYTALLQQGWRSVSLVLRTASHVVYAHKDAPAFLQDSAGHTKKWDGTGPFFDL